jgi:DNA topoisomerase-1
MKLVIIEGIGKKDTIKKYLGSGYNVMATGGHFRDLKKNALSVQIDNNYLPEYVIVSDKKEIVKKLKDTAGEAETVLIATDPDREGEAIAWHLTYILGIKPEEARRIEFNEITKNAVSRALTNPRAIDMNLVNAQQARRVLDRLVGYKLSPVLSKKIKSGLSAGRVQSVTLKLIVEREREIQNFKPEEYWDFFVNLQKDKIKFNAKLLLGTDGKKIKLCSEFEVKSVVSALDGAKYTAVDVKKSVTRRHAPAPYTTSSMQQDAGSKAGLSLKRTTMAAQTLYQGVNLGERGMTALVTYIRTDSVRVSAEAQNAAREHILTKYGKEFVPETPNFYKSKKTAQDAHEAIRPTHLDITPDEADKYCKPDESKLYRLIYNRFMASQMAEATFNSVRVDISANSYTFRVTGRTPIFDGWLAVYGGVKTKDTDKEDRKNDDKKDDETDDGAEAGELPNIEAGDELQFNKLEYAQKFTQPPARYTEATIVKAMEEKGIGRPATYTPTIQTLFNRVYIEKDGKALKPTDLGCIVVDWLQKYFAGVMDIGFTADMEDKLDDIESLGYEWTRIVDDFYKPFIQTVDYARERGEENRIQPQDSGQICEKCGRKMLIREGRFGKFLGCAGYPECKNIKPFAKPVCKCPKCGGDIYRRRAKTGRFFYGCSSYPNCDFICNDEPTGELCPKCKSPIVKTKDGVKCNNRTCDYTPPQPTAET